MTNFVEQRDAVLEKLSQAKQGHVPVLFLDEVAFTKTTHMTRTWSPRGVHIQVDQHQVYTGYRSVTATVSPDRGVVYLDSRPEIPTKELFSDYLTRLSRRMRKRPFYLFMDLSLIHI